MLGAIIGDTVGSAYEFSNTKDYDFRLFTSESDYTDDSVMTVAVASWLLRDPAHTHQGLEDAMLEFADTCPCPMGGYGTGFWTWLFYPAGLARCIIGDIASPILIFSNGSIALYP